MTPVVLEAYFFRICSYIISYELLVFVWNTTVYKTIQWLIDLKFHTDFLGQVSNRSTKFRSDLSLLTLSNSYWYLIGWWQPCFEDIWMSSNILYGTKTLHSNFQVTWTNGSLVRANFMFFFLLVIVPPTGHTQ